MKALLIALVVVAIVIFTGTWLLDIFAWLCEISVGGLRFLSDVLNLFGWNNGILGG